uniref:Uncharacterized protein n=1 Tax=Arundo donax TaxID=35708 RepID=A0A0A9F620_ARUDO
MVQLSRIQSLARYDTFLSFCVFQSFLLICLAVQLLLPSYLDKYFAIVGHSTPG